MTGEDLTDVTFVVAVPGLPLVLLALAATAISQMPKGPRRRRYATTAAALTVVMLAAAASMSWWWGVGFDYADSYRSAPAYVDTAMVTSFWIAVSACAGVLATGLVAHRHNHRRVAGQRPPVPLPLTSEPPTR